MQTLYHLDFRSDYNDCHTHIIDVAISIKENFKNNNKLIKKYLLMTRMVNVPLGMWVNRLLFCSKSPNQL